MKLFDDLVEFPSDLRLSDLNELPSDLLTRAANPKADHAASRGPVAQSNFVPLASPPETKTP